jgi:hypothetical protein
MMETAMATTAKFSKYPAYKDSGVEWLGEIPEGWEVVARNKLHFQREREGSREMIVCPCFRFPFSYGAKSSVRIGMMN